SLKWKDTSNYRIYISYPTVGLAIQYPVQLMYQHGSATPDTFSRLPATRFLSPLRSPDPQHPEAALYAHWLPASGCFLFLPPPGSGTVFLLPYPSPRLCRSTSETPLPAITR